MKLTALTVIVVIATCGCSDNGRESSSATSPSIMGKIKSGFQLATRLLGLDRATGIAQLVSDTFGGDVDDGVRFQADQKSDNLFSGFFRLLGLDAGKLGAIAINGFIFLAQLISTSFELKPIEKISHQRSTTELPLDWFTTNKRISQLLNTAKNVNLPQKIIEYVQEQTTDEESSCIQLLICKSTPLILGMQKTISNNGSKSNMKSDEGSRARHMFTTLPTLQEIAEHGDTCDQKYPYCKFLED